MDTTLKFKHPFSAIISGPSQSGKTSFTTKFLECVNELVTVPPKRIYYCYSEWQPSYNKIAALPNVQLLDGIPNLDELKNPEIPVLIVLDDLMSELSKSSTLTTLFTRGVHHWSISCIHIIQNLFFQNTRTARINASYLVLFKSPSDKLQISTLARQLYPSRARMFLDIYHDATAQAYGYLVVDLTQMTPEQLRLRTAIFPNEKVIIYMPRNCINT
jgi:hypothetical protein